MRALFALTPYESRRLIARAVAAHPDVRRAMHESYLILAGGITNGYIAEELLGEPIDKVHYTAGICAHGTYCVTPRDRRTLPFVLHRGKKVETAWDEALSRREPGIVFIKGANAIDPQGRAGIFMASPVGGTIGKALGIVQALGHRFIVPVGLEKLVPDVEAASRQMGIGSIDVSFGAPIGLMPVSCAEVITEIQALHLLASVDACMVGAGGIDGSEGQVVLTCSGSEEAVARAVVLVRSIKGEPKLMGDRADCQGCTTHCAFAEL